MPPRRVVADRRFLCKVWSFCKCIRPGNRWLSGPYALCGKGLELPADLVKGVGGVNRLAQVFDWNRAG